MSTRIKNLALALLLVAGLVQFHFAYSAYAQTVAPETPVNPTTSRNWAGYVADTGTYTGVSGTWTVPGPSASQNGSDAAWIGIGGVDSRDLLQTGTQAIVENGQIQYSAWYEALPGLEHSISMDISGGDSISASIVETSPGLWHIHIKNATNGETFDKDVEYNSSRSSAEWIEEQPTGVGFSLALDQFGSVTFTGGTATVKGASVSISGAGAHALQMANVNDETIASVSSVSADGSNFTVTRTSALSDGGMSLRHSYYNRSGFYSRSHRTYQIYVVQDQDGYHVYFAR